MKILIAHFTTHWANAVGGVEKIVCEFSNQMVKYGHEVTILYMDKIEGQPYFPLDKKVQTFNILYENGKKIISEKLPLRFRLYREICRFGGLKYVQTINAEYKGKMYGERIGKYIL